MLSNVVRVGINRALYWWWLCVVQTPMTVGNLVVVVVMCGKLVCVLILGVTRLRRYHSSQLL